MSHLDSKSCDLY